LGQLEKAALEISVIESASSIFYTVGCCSKAFPPIISALQSDVK
jgi:hypothetical protein